jgi:hypothetical protein
MIRRSIFLINEGKWSLNISNVHNQLYFIIFIINQLSYDNFWEMISMHLYFPYY